MTTFTNKAAGVLPVQNTSANLIATNPILQYGQVAQETDTNRSKSGDGVTAYNDLTYVEWNYEEVEAAGTDTYTGSFSKPFFLAYFKYMRIRVKFTNANTGAATINLNSLGAIAIRKNVSTALVAGDIIAGGIYELVYDGTNFQMITPGGNSSAIVPAALTRANDTNVTLTLGGTPATSLLQSVLLTLGWTGQLGLARGGTSIDMSLTGGTSKFLKQNTLGGTPTLTQPATTDLSDNTIWTDWSASDGLTGFSSTTEHIFRYMKIGKLVVVEIRFSGTSNATSITCTAPITSANTGSSQLTVCAAVVDNGSNQSATGMFLIASNSTSITCYRDRLATNYTASGSKSWIGMAAYESA